MKKNIVFILLIVLQIKIKASDNGAVDRGLMFTLGSQTWPNVGDFKSTNKIYSLGAQLAVEGYSSSNKFIFSTGFKFCLYNYPKDSLLVRIGGNNLRFILGYKLKGFKSNPTILGLGLELGRLNMLLYPGMNKNSSRRNNSTYLTTKPILQLPILVKTPVVRNGKLYFMFNYNLQLTKAKFENFGKVKVNTLAAGFVIYLN